MAIMKDDSMNLFLMFMFCLFGGVVGFVLGDAYDFKTLSRLDYIIIIIAALPTLALVFVTYYYATRTNKLVNVQTEPILDIMSKKKFEQNRVYVYVAIKNSGTTSAYDLKFTFNPADYEYIENTTLSEFDPLKKGIPYLYPKQEKIFRLSDTAKLKKQEEYCEIKIDYKNSLGDQQVSKSYVNFIGGMIDYGTEEIVSRLNLINGSLEFIAGAIGSENTRRMFNIRND